MTMMSSPAKAAMDSSVAMSTACDHFLRLRSVVLLYIKIGCSWAGRSSCARSEIVIYGSLCKPWMDSERG